MEPTTAHTLAHQEALAFGPGDFERIADLLHRLVGIRLTTSNESMVLFRLDKRLKALGMSRISDYLNLVCRSDEIDERSRFISALTTNTTRFFREPEHFDIFRADLLPRFMHKARQGERVRIWSAGCSTGEEPYSLAMTILSEFPDAALYDFKILATDIDHDVIEKARRGIYKLTDIQGIPDEIRKLGFPDQHQSPDHSAASDSLKALIHFKLLNLVGVWPFKGHFDAIFCRNVAIYMDAETQSKVWRSFAQVTAPGGYLFVGHSERLPAGSEGSFQLINKTTYRRMDRD